MRVGFSRCSATRSSSPTGLRTERDVIRHNGSVVILAIDRSKSKKNPWIVMERQYRHAANQFLWELPAGKLEAGEDPLAGAKRELAEETGYQAKNWKPLVQYWPSPGFLGEPMLVFLAEGLYVTRRGQGRRGRENRAAPGEALRHPQDDRKGRDPRRQNPECRASVCEAERTQAQKEMTSARKAPLQSFVAVS